ncbi:3-phenylpropionate/trans-cinnamate dioxygenase ferredoxin subunit [Tamaricihabitans halophyticus]|uniref:3-phenylpropionate/trans-cinnamate dioxygenase ferredoxin subunit n=1 Tax=Tamaricihabitans halophyticus TaxID=1262583 RepID=A0A4R2QQI7_9PSEU|nr:bifunctional 3-phenylpropionate/cinnamic acid dioxygenase ferredoxin subunit [Tamaricihabitans halophyticus]TCP51867.1 3-phenylpropionate/trans-cinnamate dioxygenase ferredoxin subunit [Tamaricihabitans halophyticus]
MIAVCRTDEIATGESVKFDADVPIAVFNADGEFYAVDDTCSHQDASLSDGFLEGCYVECPLHAALFDLRTGMPSCLPAKRPIRTHMVSVEDGWIYVNVAGQSEEVA